jgi:two-component system, NarL family, nitrate/nitrite response regulator NarL
VDDVDALLAILLVIDVRVYRDAMVSILERVPRLRVCGTATESAEAVQRACELRPDFVLMDASIPGGITAVQSLKHLRPPQSVVVFAVSESAVIRFADAGVAGFVLRNDPVDQLAAVVQGVAHGEMPCSPTVAAALLQHVSVLAAQSPETTFRSRLTARELEIANLVGEGLSNKEIGNRLYIELPTVKNHVHRILEKLQISRRIDVGRRLEA